MALKTSRAESNIVPLVWGTILLSQVLRFRTMSAGEWFPWLALTGIVLGPYFIYEAKGLAGKIIGWVVAVPSSMGILYVTYTFLPSWLDPYFFAVVAVLLGVAVAISAKSRFDAHAAQAQPDALAMSNGSIELRMTPAPDSGRVPYVQFVTSNRAEREIDAGGRPNKLRFLMPREQLIVERDLPATVRIGWGRKLVVKRFTTKGFTLEEHATHGVTVRIETYFDAPHKARMPRRSWPSPSQRQISELRNRFAVIPPNVGGRKFRNIQILRVEFPDCVDLADDIAEAFRTAWADPTILPGKPWGDLKEGIWIVGPRDDPRSPILLSILSEVLGVEYEPLGLEPSPPAPLRALDLAVTIRIEIGRKPRHN